ncbi:MAG: DUF420 domain-containing protein [Planctomycetales bacterium]|nr:DUF420 domain-containing protein [Planctomycetales bacterium]
MLAQIDYPGPEGFLGFRGSLMLDVVVVAMVVVLAVMAWSVLQVRSGRFEIHKWTQVVLTSVLMLAVLAFEIEMRLFGWEDRAAGQIGGKAEPLVWNVLYAHLIFAVSSFFLWPIVVVRALRNFPRPPRPGEHSRGHLFWARLAAVCMTVTAITGWLFYYVGFVRTPNG